ncbi:FAD-binding FR-type domain-containing protein [Pycnococcus provasolii]
MDGADDATEYKARILREELAGISSEPSAKRPAVNISKKVEQVALTNGMDSNGYAKGSSMLRRQNSSRALQLVIQDATPGEAPGETGQPTVSDAATSSRVIGRAQHELSRVWRPHTVIYLLSAIMLLYALVRSFAPEPVGLLRADAACTNAPLFKCVCPRKTVCAEDWPSLFLLALARGSAYMDYPLYVALFLSKCHNLRSALGNSYISEWLPFHDLHKLHVFAGWIVGVETFSHSIAHMVRWSLQGNANFFFSTQTGRTGILAMLCTPLIVWPMALKSLRVRYRWETRKTMHYLALVWGICVACHAPATHVAWVMGTVVALYCADFLYGAMCKIKLIRSTHFIRLENCVEMSFEHPHGFSSDGTGYVMVCLPWISKSEWHAFSLFKHPKKDNSSAVCIAVAGDWTKKLHDALDRPTVRHAWIAGPYASPYGTAIKYDNLLCVASGIGITPAISIITTHGSGSMDRRVHLIWICRDPSLIEFYVKRVSFDSRGWTLIYYTGKSRPLVLDSEDLPPSVLIFRKRPYLERVMADIIYGIEGGHGLPEQLLAKAADFRNEIFRGDQEGARLEKMLLMIVQVHGRDAFFDMCSKESSDERRRRSRSSFDGVQSNKSLLTQVTASTAIPSSRQAWQSNKLQQGQSIDISQQTTSPVKFIKSRPGSGMLISEESSSRETAMPDGGEDSAQDVSEARLNVVNFETDLLEANAFSSNSRDPVLSATREAFLDVPAMHILPTATKPRGGGPVVESTRSISMTLAGFKTTFVELAEALAHQELSEFELELVDVMYENIVCCDRTERWEDEHGIIDVVSELKFDIFVTQTMNKSMNSVDENDGVDISVHNGNSLPHPGRLNAPRKSMDAIDFLGNPDNSTTLKAWQMMYCGGAQSIADELSRISQSFGINLEVEKFDW